MPNRFWNRKLRTLFIALSAAFLACGSGAGIAGEDHDRARQALEAGEILPLHAILDRIEREYPGQVIDVELERDRGNGTERWIYEVKILRSGGSLVKLKVDARDGSIIRRKTKGGDDGDKARQIVPHGGAGR